MAKKKLRWLAIYRNLFDHWIASRNDWLAWWLKMLFAAAEKDEEVMWENMTVKVKRGQFVCSISSLQKMFNCKSNNTVLKFLNKLTLEEMCTVDVHRRYRIVSICNFGIYQFSEEGVCIEGVHKSVHRGAKKEAKKEYAIVNKDYQSLSPIALEKEKDSNAEKAQSRLTLRDSFFARLAEDLEVRRAIMAEFGFRDTKMTAMYMAAFMGHIIEKQPNKAWKSFDDFVKHCKNWIGKQNEQTAKENVKTYKRYIQTKKQQNNANGNR